MKSELVYHRKWVLDENEIMEVKIWKVPVSRNYPEGIKYSLVYIKDGVRILAYDNYQGHGHHKHYKEKIVSYNFDSIEILIRDFWLEVKNIRETNDES